MLRAGIGLWLLIAGCESPAYEIVVHVPGGVQRARAVEISVIGSCTQVAEMGAPVSAPLRQVDATAAGAALGELAPGVYALYGRAWEAGCRLYAAGCQPIELEAGGSSTLQLYLVEVQARGCDPPLVCSGDRCLPESHAEDAGPEPDAAAKPDAAVEPDASRPGPDASTDASVAPDAAVEPECTPWEAEVEPCGFCGTQERVCLESGLWDAWQPCTEETGECYPGAIEVDCCVPLTSARQRECSDDCIWAPWSDCLPAGC